MSGSHWIARKGKYLAAGVVFLGCLYFLVEFFRVRVSFAVGMVLLGISLLMPLREDDEEWELVWDTAGWLVAMVIALVCGRYLREPTFDFIRSLDFVQAHHETLRQAPDWVTVIVFLLLVDVMVYWGHRALHHRQLWDHHAWHHAPRYLTWLNGTRTTLVNHIFLTTLPGLVVGTLYPMPRAEGAVILIMGIQRLADHVHHSNLRLPFARQLEYVVVTPRYHFVHHAAERRYSDSNFGFVFSFWDRLFGTYTDPEQLGNDYPLGLNYENLNWRLMLGLPPVRQRK